MCAHRRVPTRIRLRLLVCAAALCSITSGRTISRLTAQLEGTLGGAYGTDEHRQPRSGSESRSSCGRRSVSNGARTPSYGWFSGRPSAGPTETEVPNQNPNLRDPQAAPPLLSSLKNPADVRGEIDRLRAEVSTLKASQSIETFKLIKSHQEKYDTMKREMEAINNKVDKLKEKAEPKVTFLSQALITLGWMFSILDFLLKWSW
eukprot:CAMPEP_0114503116 /NCGR_PEP_ID=MMETSP0109-20121206/9472_1 /TAXON_ID=29199 /ORGANISM="Chlorarachnion reptans, Strain CCCM449" /LENGTH=203 /DNA_ID=CAMNT_0001681115 /DNA_START=102 /DNA_END=710 /DNA_ORIENTATION=-